MLFKTLYIIKTIQILNIKKNYFNSIKRYKARLSTPNIATFYSSIDIKKKYNWFSSSNHANRMNCNHFFRSREQKSVDKRKEENKKY